MMNGFQILAWGTAQSRLIGGRSADWFRDCLRSFAEIESFRPPRDLFLYFEVPSLIDGANSMVDDNLQRLTSALANPVEKPAERGESERHSGWDAVQSPLSRPLHKPMPRNPVVSSGSRSVMDSRYRTERASVGMDRLTVPEKQAGHAVRNTELPRGNRRRAPRTLLARLHQGMNQEKDAGLVDYEANRSSSVHRTPLAFESRMRVDQSLGETFPKKRIDSQVSASTHRERSKTPSSSFDRSPVVMTHDENETFANRLVRRMWARAKHPRGVAMNRLSSARQCAKQVLGKTVEEARVPSPWSIRVHGQRASLYLLKDQVNRTEISDRVPDRTRKPPSNAAIERSVSARQQSHPSASFEAEPTHLSGLSSLPPRIAKPPSNPDNPVNTVPDSDHFRGELNRFWSNSSPARPGQQEGQGSTLSSPLPEPITNQGTSVMDDFSAKLQSILDDDARRHGIDV